MHRAVEFVGPCCIRKDAFDAKVDLGSGLFLAHDPGESLDDFTTPLGEVLRTVIENLRPIVRRSLCPCLSLASRFDGIANVFTTAQRSFA